MRLFRSLLLLLPLIVSSALADDLYQVEMILLRQNTVPATFSRVAPEDWAAGAQRLDAQSQRSPALGGIVEKLSASGDYSVLMHQAWQQTLGETPVKVAVSEGREQFGQFPIAGTLNLKLGRVTDVEAQFWVNQIDGNGLITASEQLKQQSHTKNGQLNYLDSGHLALLIKITSLSAPPPQQPSLAIPD